MILAIGIGLQVVQFIRSIKYRKENKDLTGDPWNGRTLEWSTSSPPPLYNFAIAPVVHERDAFWAMKQKGIDKKGIHYEDILMPKDTPMGFVIGMFSFIFGFAIIWQIVWLTILGFVGVVGCLIQHLSCDDTEYFVPASKVKEIEEGL
jgi:cytochrome o ubiquinol oxidase subunit 1